MIRKNILCQIVLFSVICVLNNSCGKSDDEEQTPTTNETETYPVAESGWDIYDGGGYRYGPSIIINDDGTIDAWFAAPGGSFGDVLEAYDSGSSSEAVSLGSANVAAQFFSTDVPFYSVDVCCPTWSGNEACLTLSLYKWDTDYNTTIKSSPINSKRFENYADNAWLSLTNVVSEGEDYVKFSAGKYLWVLNNGTTVYSGVWKNSGTNTDVKSVSYLNGLVTSGNYQARIMKEQSSGTSYWDQASYKRSTDGGKAWSDEVMALKPTENSRDAYSVCDPAVAKWGGYYYIGYTSTEDAGGVDNHVYMCRGTSPFGPWEKWNGAGWGGNPQPVVEYTGNHSNWGAGEPSIVILNDTVYLYYSWNDGGTTTRLVTAPANVSDWPAHLTQRGMVIDKSSIASSDHCDVKYRDDVKKFYAVHTAARMTENSYIMLWESSDGINFKKVGKINGIFQKYLHNCGLSGDEQGHIDVAKQQYISYAYGDTWGDWKTRWSPLKFE